MFNIKLNQKEVNAMSVIAGKELHKLVANKVIEGVAPDNINAASIDITLGDIIKYEDTAGVNIQNKAISLACRDQLPMQEVKLSERCGQFILAPGQFILAATNEVFNLPNNISAEYKLKSSMARIGLDHLNAGWCDAGWNNSVLTLELKNVTQATPIVLDFNTAIGQVIFYKHEEVSADQSYAKKGNYNNQAGPQGATKQEPAKEVEPKGIATQPSKDAKAAVTTTTKARANITASSKK